MFSNILDPNYLQLEIVGQFKVIILQDTNNTLKFENGNSFYFISDLQE